MCEAICEFLIASCESDGGVYKYRLYNDGTAEQLGKISAPSPMFLQTEGDKLWAVLKAPFENSRDSGIAVYGISSGERLGEILCTRGEVGCHIAVNGTDVYCANYLTGSVFLAPSSLKAHEGGSINPKRQASPHAHSVLFSPCGKYLLCCDLGLDTVLVYDRALNEISRAKVPAGEGVRHAVFSADGKYLYCINEMGGSISVFSWNAPRLGLLHTVSILPENHVGIGSGAAIKLSNDGKYLYATERASATIVTLRAEGEHLSVISHTDCRGTEPRDLALLAGDRFAVCTNQKSHSVAIFEIENDAVPKYLTSFELPSPLCAVQLSQFAITE